MTEDNGQHDLPEVPISRRQILQLTGGATASGLLSKTVRGKSREDEYNQTSILPDEIEKSNSTISAGNAGDITQNENEFTISAENANVRVIFYGSNVFRIWLGPDGDFSNPANDGNDENSENIVIDHDFEDIQVEWTDQEDYYELATESISLRAYKQPLRFELRNAEETLIWSEAESMTWSEDGSVQKLKRSEEEQFFGGGMQNGRFSHRDEMIDISTSSNWNDGGHPNPAPFYMSTAGYGVFRNTYSPGQYSFENPVKTAHNEQRFDAYYFYGPELKQILDLYTTVTGKPFMPPIYGLEFGDADCYNDDGESTYPDAVEVAQQYVEHDMPRGWMLVNDGYGCGYVQLERVIQELLNRDIRTGLWTEDGLPDEKYEINVGTRVRKLDVAWIGAGYEFAMNAAQHAYDGIEQYSNARGYVWMVEGWAGAQRHALMWTGDQSGDWDNIRFHIPTLHGSGNSAQWVGSDIDGIFGGSAKTYTRDLQWKMFTPAFLGMSGWASKDKQPWAYGEPHTSINRKYLRLRERLLPYFYTYAAEAHQQGTPLTRSLVLEYPEDPRTWDETSKYEFLAGESFLVAPVYEDTETRDNIYLPEDRWVDYWSGKVYDGPQIVNDYHAPLDKLPLFVKAGAIIPKWPEGINNHRDVSDDDPITFDVYPKGDSEFTLYEDDGVTQQYREGEFAEQTILVDAPKAGPGKVDITVEPSQGEYEGKPDNRPYRFTVHTGIEPAVVRWNGRILEDLSSEDEYNNASKGWYYDEEDRGGIVYIKTEAVSLDEFQTVRLQPSSAIGGAPQVEIESPVLVDLELPTTMEPAAENKITATFVNGYDNKKLHNVDVSLATPDGWEAKSRGSTSIDQVNPGESVTLTYLIIPSKEAYGDSFEIRVDAEYKIGDSRHTVWEVASTETGLKVQPPTTDTWASNLKWDSATNGWGPVERDQSVGGQSSNDGNQITLNGTKYEKGLGVHARSNIKYLLDSNCKRFTATVGVDDEAPDYGSVVFHVIADSDEIYKSNTLTGKSDTEQIDVSLDGVDTVELLVTNAGDGKSGDHADWAEAKFHC